MKYDVSYKTVVALCCELNDEHKKTPRVHPFMSML